ncbi:MAG: HD domain-containing protein [Candidatus Stahlbacteria bacterium]|nr:HD domain-containing protein [Candidatus Stahlbacteria bacterium]
MEIRDSIHSLIKYDETEEKLINTSIFQRLRKIKQLALASFVYPGAHHTRFEHSIGTMHLAEKVARRLELNEEKVKILRLAGLLHDIGHGPFSHVSEQIMEEYADKTLLDKYKAHNTHELMSILLIQKDKEIGNILNQDEKEKIAHILQRQEKKSIERDIISGPLDVDKLDYLLRDSYFAGVKYGLFDLDKVIESLTLIEIGREKTQLGINEDGIHPVEQLLLAKYHMNTQVYQHRVRRITDAMLIRGIKYALEEESKEVENIYRVQDTNEFIENYLKYDDKSLVDTILSNAKGVAREYFKRIKTRKLLKEVFSAKINETNFPDSVNNEVDSKLVVVDKQTVSNPTFKSPGVRIDTNTIMVKTMEGGRKSFPQISTIFSNSAVDPEEDILRIYLPLDWIEKREDRKKFITERKDKTIEIIEEVLR